MELQENPKFSMFLSGAWTALYLAVLGTMFGCLIGFGVRIVYTVPNPLESKRLKCVGIGGAKIIVGAVLVLGLCALPGFVDSKNEEKTERNAGYLVVSQSGGGMLRQGTRKGIRRTPANRGMRAHWVVKGLDISEDVCHGMCP